MGRVYSAFLTGENFVRRDVKREDIPLQFWETATSEQILLEVHESAFADVQDWLGCENMSLAENETEQTAPDSLPCTPATGFTPEKPAAPFEESGTESGEKSDFSADFSADSPSDSSSRVQRVRYAKAVLPVDDVLAKNTQPRRGRKSTRAAIAPSSRILPCLGNLGNLSGINRFPFSHSIPLLRKP